MFVSPEAADPPEWPGPVNYIGGIGGFSTGMSMWPNRDRRMESDVAAVFLNLVTTLPSNVIRQGAQCQAVIGGRTVDLAEAVCKVAQATNGTGFRNIFQYVNTQLIRIWELGAS